MPKTRCNHDDLSGLERRLDRWRRSHGGPGRRIPEELWWEAAEVARAEGVGPVARALRLRRARLETLVGRLSVEPGTDEPAVEGSDFVELRLGHPPGGGGAQAQAVIHLEMPDGIRVTVEVVAGDIGGVVDAMLGRLR